MFNVFELVDKAEAAGIDTTGLLKFLEKERKTAEMVAGDAWLIDGEIITFPKGSILL